VKNKIGTTGYTEKPENATEWSTRSRAKEFGIGQDEVNLILRERDITPRFLKRLDKSCEEGKVLHLIVDNNSRQKTKGGKGYRE
jgi:hypothetical protein